MSKESLGAFYGFNRPSTLLRRDAKPTRSQEYEASVIARLELLCFPLRMQYCFSDGLQKALFQLMDLVSTNDSLAARIMPQLIAFLERIDTNNVLWASACESGFAFNFMRKLLNVAPIEDKEAIAGFLIHKIDQLTTTIVAVESTNSTLPLFLQEILHAVAASNSVDWTEYYEPLFRATQNLIT